MNWTSLAGTLAEFGLTALGTAIGGPLGGTIGKGIAEALGVDPTPEAVEQALRADPETAKERLADIESARRADVDTLRIEADSSASARQMQIVAMEHSASQENTPTILAYLNLALISFVVVALLGMPYVKGAVDFPAGTKEILVLILGVLVACLKDSQGFFFGTSRSSERNGAAMRSIATSANVPTPAQQVGQAVGAAINKAVKR